MMDREMRKMREARGGDWVMSQLKQLNEAHCKPSESIVRDERWPGTASSKAGSENVKVKRTATKVEKLQRKVRYAKQKLLDTRTALDNFEFPAPKPKIDVAKAKVEKWEAQVGLREARVGVEKAKADVEYFEKTAEGSGTSEDVGWAAFAKDILEERKDIEKKRSEVAQHAKEKEKEVKKLERKLRDRLREADPEERVCLLRSKLQVARRVLKMHKLSLALQQWKKGKEKIEVKL